MHFNNHHYRLNTTLDLTHILEKNQTKENLF